MKKMLLLLGMAFLVVSVAPAWSADFPNQGDPIPGASQDLTLQSLPGTTFSPALADLAPAEPWRLHAGQASRRGGGSFLDSLITRDQMEGVHLDGREQAKATVVRMLFNLAARNLD